MMLVILVVLIVPSLHGPIPFRLTVHPLLQLVVRILPGFLDPTEKDTVLHLTQLTEGSIHR